MESPKFGGSEYTPYEIYMKAHFEYLHDDLDRDLSDPATRCNLAPYNLEAYKATDAVKDDFELGREEAFVDISRSRFLKRLAASHGQHLRRA